MIFNKGRRKNRRVDTHVLLDVSLMNDADMRSKAEIINISMGGANFACDFLFGENTGVNMKFTLHGNDVYFLPSKIVWRKKLTNTNSYGISFSGLTKYEKKQLKKLIKKIRVI